MFKLTIVIIFVSLLTACTSIEDLENHYTEIGSKCIVIEKSMSAVEECIGVDFYENKYRDQIVKDYQSCKPYWGYPFVSSCGGLKVIYKQDKTVTEWFAWGQLDGL